MRLTKRRLVKHGRGKDGDRNGIIGDILGLPEVRTLPFYCKGTWVWSPVWGIKIRHVNGLVKKKNRIRIIMNCICICTVYLSIYLSSIYLPIIYLSIYLSAIYICLSTYWSHSDNTICCLESSCSGSPANLDPMLGRFASFTSKESFTFLVKYIFMSG